MPDIAPVTARRFGGTVIVEVTAGVCNAVLTPTEAKALAAALVATATAAATQPTAWSGGGKVLTLPGDPAPKKRKPKKPRRKAS